ncbi:hypothetical protein [Patulibacter americanus]|uniref:hypothetical protein n=1 Tax=Patulibacter americanus TaxID=588672 RepID=UPI0003B3AC8D|nr:hypothetical protein [Patulibacter americanus]
MAAVLTALLGAAPADARSIHDPDIGWPTALREELGLPVLRSAPCRARTTRAKIRLQNRVSRAEPPLRGILRYGEADVWGSAWYTNCDGGRLQVGIASGAPAPATRRIVRTLRRRLAKRGLTNDVRLVAVRSTYKQLDEQAELVDTAVVPGALEAGHISTGIRTTRNAVSIDVYNTIPPADLVRLRAFARDAPVNVVLDVEPPADPDAPVATYPGAIVLDRRAVRRDRRELPVVIDDQSCFGDESFDSAARLAAVRVRRGRHAWILTARFRVNPDWPRFSTCVGSSDPRLRVRTTVRLPSRLGHRGIVDGGDGRGGSRPVLLEPRGAVAIRSLVPRFVYAGDACDRPAVRRAFRGRPKSGWCFF